LRGEDKGFGQILMKNYYKVFATKGCVEKGNKHIFRTTGRKFIQSFNSKSNLGRKNCPTLLPSINFIVGLTKARIFFPQSRCQAIIYDS